MDDERIKKLAKLAGFKYSHRGNGYLCFQSENTNKFLVYTSVKEETLLKQLFEECRLAGQTKLRLEYSKLLNPLNYNLV